MVGGFLTGRLLDRRHVFKVSNIVTACCGCLCLICFTFTVDMKSIVVGYIITALYKFFAASHVTTGCQLALEIAYPQSETVISAVFYATSHPFGLAITSLCQAIIDSVRFQCYFRG